MEDLSENQRVCQRVPTTFRPLLLRYTEWLRHSGWLDGYETAFDAATSEQVVADFRRRSDDSDPPTDRRGMSDDPDIDNVIYPPHGYWIGYLGRGSVDGMIGPFATQQEAREAWAECNIVVTGMRAGWDE